MAKIGHFRFCCDNSGPCPVASDLSAPCVSFGTSTITVQLSATLADWSTLEIDPEAGFSFNHLGTGEVQISIQDGFDGSAQTTWRVSNVNCVSNDATLQWCVDAEVPNTAVSLSMTGPSVPVEPDDPAAYVITVSNSGTTDATNLLLTETVPVGTNFDPALSPGWTLVSGSTYQYVIPSLSSGNSLNVSFGVSVDSPPTVANFTNTASVVTYDQIGTDQTPPANQTDSVTTLVDIPLITIDKSGPAGPVVSDDEVCYVVTVTNAGGATATNVQVTDILPVGMTYDAGNSNPDWIGVSSGVIQQVLASVPTGSVTLDVCVIVNNPQPEDTTSTNTARIDSYDQEDTDPQNDWESTVDTSIQADPPPKRVAIVDEMGGDVPLAEEVQPAWGDPCITTLAEKEAWVATQVAGSLTYIPGDNEWEIDGQTGATVTLPVVTCDYFGTQLPTGADLVITSNLDSGPGTLREALEAGVTNRKIVPDVGLGRIRLYKDIDSGALDHVWVDGIETVGGEVAFENFQHLTVTESRFYGGLVVKGENSLGSATDSVAFRNGTFLHVHNNAFALGSDGNVDMSNVDCYAFHHNIDMFGLDPARGHLVTGSRGMEFNNFTTHNGSRPNFQNGTYLAESNLTYNNRSRMYSTEDTGPATQTDFINNINHAGPGSTHGGVGILCANGSPEIYESGNTSLDENGNSISWSTQNCTSVSPTQLNHWLSCADAVPDINTIGTSSPDCLEQRAKDLFTNLQGLPLHPLGGNALQGYIFNPSEIGWDFLTGTCFTVRTADEITFAEWDYNFSAKEITVDVDGMTDATFTTPLTSATTYNFRLVDNDGTIIWGADNVPVGSDLGAANDILGNPINPLSGSIPGAIKPGSTVSGAGGHYLIDVTNIYNATAGPQRELLIEVTINNVVPSYSGYRIPL